MLSRSNSIASCRCSWLLLLRSSLVVSVSTVRFALRPVCEVLMLDYCLRAEFTGQIESTDQHRQETLASGDFVGRRRQW